RAAQAEAARRRDWVWFADAAVTHSRFTRDELCAATGFPSERVHTLGLVCDDAFFAPGAASRTPPTLLFVGRLAPNKRVPLVIEALARLVDRHTDLRALVIGAGGEVYGRELDRCRRVADEFGVADRVEFAGRVSRERLRDAYRSASVLVMPSVHEGFCVPVI